MNNILVTGGAGYIGSHITLQLIEAGHQVVVLDNLYSGHRWAIDQRATFIESDIADQVLTEALLKQHKIDTVIHFAGHIVVPESVDDPLKYYQNNVSGSLNLLHSCIKAGVKQFIFSSSAAVYGIPSTMLVNEQTEKKPINPYGTTKLITEWKLRDLAAAQPDFRYVALRYFNVAGAHQDGILGQATPEATHLIKVACQAATGQRNGMAIFGDDYDTEDGTCVRDYIHVQDLAGAHLDALGYLNKDGASIAVNVGYGKGATVKQVIDCVKKVSGVDFPVEIQPRRQGDPMVLVADNSLIHKTFNWQPKFNDLETICKHAYDWEVKSKNKLRGCPR